jgi:hypothetical protein
MTYTITQFANDTTPALPDLDQNFNAAFVLTPVPCTVSGTDALTLTQNSAGQAASGTIATYENGLQLCGIATATNTTATTARLGALAVLNVYKDSVAGPVALSGGEIVADCAFTLRYDAALNASAGGWHLITSTPTVGNTISPALVRASVGVQVASTTAPTLTGLLSATATLTYTSIVPNSSQDQSFTVANLLSTDGLAMSLPLPVSAGISFNTYFAAGNATIGTVTVRAGNITAASTITPGAITVSMKGIRLT